jgi:hypothetical protein
MAEADDRARKLRELDALHDYYGMKYKIDLEKNEEESRNLSTCMPLDKRVLTLREQGNWAQAQVSCQVTHGMLTILMRSSEMATDR